MDHSQVASNREFGEYEILRQAGLDVREDGIDGLMHHKVFIIDEQIVITGSYNFSRSAEEKNDENIIVIYNTDIAQEYLKEFARVQAQATVNEEN
jgi:phosphatidylserine/phosphatidylglycerophosphate/cardiolipin synthase-like enzyme